MCNANFKLNPMTTTEKILQNLSKSRAIKMTDMQVVQLYFLFLTPVYKFIFKKLWITASLMSVLMVSA